jgi:hypothetical protein
MQKCYGWSPTLKLGSAGQIDLAEEVGQKRPQWAIKVGHKSRTLTLTFLRYIYRFAGGIYHKINTGNHCFWPTFMADRFSWPTFMADFYGRLLWPTFMADFHGRLLWSTFVGYGRLLRPTFMAD